MTETILEFEPASRRLRNVTQGNDYVPLPLTPKEDEMRQSGGIFAAGRRELRTSVAHAPSIEWPGPELARTMTATEQILWAHRVDKECRGRARRDASRLCGPVARVRRHGAVCDPHLQPDYRRSARSVPRQAAIANDHFVFTGRADDENQTAIGRAFAAQHGIEPPYYATPGDGIFHFYFPEQGLVFPGQFIPGADSHSRAYGAYGAVGIGVGSTTLGFGWATGYVYVTLARARRVVFTGRIQPWVGGKDIVLELLRRWGTKQAQGMSVELVDRDGQIPMPYRNTIANMMAEAEAMNGIFAADAVTTRVVSPRAGSTRCRTHKWPPAATRITRSTRRCRSTRFSR